MSEFLIKLNLFPIYIPNSLGSSPYLNLKKLINNLNPHGLLLSGGEDIGKNISRDNLEKSLKIFYSKEKTDLRNL